MSRTQRLLGWPVTLLVGAFSCAFGASVVDQAADRLRARDGAPAAGTVVERFRSAKAWIPTVEVAYEVDGRTYRRELDAYLDEGERVRVRYLPEDPAVSRVEGAGLTGLVLGFAGALAAGGMTLVSVRRLLETRQDPSPPRRRERPREVVRRPVRLRRGAAVGAALGALLWAVLAALAGAGPPREVATALGGLSGAAASLGAAVALLRAGVRRRGLRYWLAVAALVAGAPLVLAVAVALEG